MKNSLPFAALTFAFTVAGLALGCALHDDPAALAFFGLIIAAIGSLAAATCRVQS